MNDSLIRLKDVCRIWPVSAPTVYRRIKTGQFPQPVKMGHGSFWWLSSVYEALGNPAGMRYAPPDASESR